MSEQTEIQAAMAGINTMSLSTLSAVMKSVGLDKETRTRAHSDLENMRAILGWADSSGLEKLLIEDVVLCWLRRECCDQHLSHNSAGENYTQRTAAHFEARLSQAHHRYLSAVMALAKVRRLGTIQINIGQNQLIGYTGRDAINPPAPSG